MRRVPVIRVWVEGRSTLEDRRPRSSYHQIYYVFMAWAVSACHWNWTAAGNDQRPTEDDSHQQAPREKLQRVTDERAVSNVWCLLCCRQASTGLLSLHLSAIDSLADVVGIRQLLADSAMYNLCQRVVHPAVRCWVFCIIYFGTWQIWPLLAPSPVIDSIRAVCMYVCMYVYSFNKKLTWRSLKHRNYNWDNVKTVKRSQNSVQFSSYLYIRV